MLILVFLSELEGTYKRGPTECDYLNSWRHTEWGDVITTYLADRIAQIIILAVKWATTYHYTKILYFWSEISTYLPHQQSAKDDEIDIHIT